LKVQRWFALLFAFAAAFSSVVANAEKAREERLRELRQAIEKRREQVLAYERDERGLLETLETFDIAALHVNQALVRARNEAEAARAESEALEEQLRALDQRRAHTQHALAARAVALYKSGELGPLQFLFSARELRDLLRRARTLRLLIHNDQKLLARFEAETASLRQLQERSRTALAMREDSQVELAERQRALDDERAARQQLLSRVRGSRTRERSLLVELEAAARALEEALTQFEREPSAVPSSGSTLMALRGKLTPPVTAPIVRGFGRVVDGEFRTETFRKGVDFAAAEGTSVRAIAPGRVRYAGWFRGYGNLVILDHGAEYFSISGHLAELLVKTGDAVEAGDVLGAVGATGSLSGPLLYFEIRHGQEPLDPSLWLALE